MFYLSKSNYCGFWQCPKILWLRKYKSEAFLLSPDVLARMETGNEVGDLAMGLFGSYTEVTAYDGERLDLAKMIAATEAEMEKGTPVICEASFCYEGLYCAVDLLKKEPRGWAIYEVKSSVHHRGDGIKPVYAADIAYQKYVLEHCGVKVCGTYLVQLNADYVSGGTLDLQKLFTVTDAAEGVAEEAADVADNLARAAQLLASAEEPDIDLNAGCREPYECGFWEYCTSRLPKPSVFDLYRMPFASKLDYYYQGLYGFEKLAQSACVKSEKQQRQIQYALGDLGTYIDRDGIRSFLDTLSYPLYFLDFETMQPAVPLFAGTRPYQQIPFQYSLHYIEAEGGELKHTEFLAEAGTDPRRALAERLCADIPADVCVTAYNKAFECTRIQELADAFPDLSAHLLSIRGNIKDLLTPFQSGCYYNRAMGGSFSIKSVLPAMFPNDPALDYHSLEGVHNGAEAMTVFPKLLQMPPDEQAHTRHNLLKYCELDTYAMVKVWEALKDAAR